MRLRTALVGIALTSLAVGVGAAVQAMIPSPRKAVGAPSNLHTPQRPAANAPSPVAPKGAVVPRKLGAIPAKTQPRAGPIAGAAAARKAASAPDTVERRWEAEELDPGATDELTERVSNALNSQGLEQNLDEVACRKTLCKVRVHFTDLREALAFQNSTQSQAWASQSIEMADGLVDLEVFMNRE